jgi:NAD(P)-dependent dehydrogenase (short-subunit alcohol dehydrogenase family)
VLAGGLGLETCRQLGQREFRVILTARNEPEGRAAAERLATEGIAVEYRPLDVSSPSSPSALASGLIADGI